MLPLPELTLEPHSASVSHLASFRSFVDLSPAPAWIESQGRIVHANAPALEALGAAKAVDLIGREVSSIRSGGAVMRLDGQPVPALFSSRDFVDNTLQPRFVTFQTTTNYPPLPAAFAGVTSAGRILEVVLEAAGYGGWIADAHGRILYVGRAIQELTGLSGEQFAAMGWVQALRTEDAQPVLKAWLAGIAAGEPWTTQLSLRGVDGRYHPMMSTAAPVRDNDGRTVLFAGTMVGVESLKERQHDLQLENEILTRANKELEQFAFNASHDLQDPLRIVRLMTELVLARWGDSLQPEAKTQLSTIQDAAARMSTLVHDLLVYARLLHRNEPAASTDLNAVFQTALLNCQASIQESGAIVTCDPLPTVLAEANQIASVFQNLLGNAIKYARPGVPPQLSVTVDRRGAEWRFCVSDNGEGVPVERQAEVFLPFKRLHGPELPGSGLGLAVCKKIIEHHGGRMWLESEPGVGSLFYFTLPVE